MSNQTSSGRVSHSAPGTHAPNLLWRIKCTGPVTQWASLRPQPAIRDRRDDGEKQFVDSELPEGIGSGGHAS